MNVLFIDFLLGVNMSRYSNHAKQASPLTAEVAFSIINNGIDRGNLGEGVAINNHDY